MGTEGAKKRRILLVQCAFDPRFAELRSVDFDAERGFSSSAGMVPLSCATIAALTPPEYEVDIWDEGLRGQIRADTPLGDYDIVGVSLLFSSLAYQGRFLGVLFQARGVTVVAGGPAVSAAPEEYRPFFDAIFVNEAERTWPEFLRDLERGEPRAEYRQIDKPPLTESPAPRWDSIAATMGGYGIGSVQTTRGCPFDCEFCDVIYLFGRRQRHKSVEQVVEEVRALARFGLRWIFVVDDEFVGDPPHAKEVLRALVALNASLPRPIRFFTQTTMNLSRDDEMLELAADAGFYSALVGVESFDQDSLRETHKLQNIRRDLVGDIRKIQSYGIGLRATFIVGFDHDGPDVFDRLFEGVTAAAIPWVSVAMLRAAEGTRLWSRLHAEGRLVRLRGQPTGEHALLGLNLVPKKMSRVELIEGYYGLTFRLYAWEAATARIADWAHSVRRPPGLVEPEPTLAAIDRFLVEASEAWALSAAERAAVGDTLREAYRQTPHLTHRVMYFLMKNQFEKRRYQAFLAGIDGVLEAERQADFVVERTPMTFPAEAANALRAFFPVLYTRLHRSLPDVAALPEAAREVLVDFLLRWGRTFQTLEPHHEVSLLELCDRSATKRGGHPAPVSPSDERALSAEVRRSRLADAVLKDVRDELANLAPPEAPGLQRS